MLRPRSFRLRLTHGVACVQNVCEIADTLFDMLLSTEDAHAIDDYAALRGAALAQLAACAPLQVGRRAAASFWSRNHSLGVRADALATLLDGATLLAATNPSANRVHDATAWWAAGGRRNADAAKQSADAPGLGPKVGGPRAPAVAAGFLLPASGGAGAGSAAGGDNGGAAGGGAPKHGIVSADGKTRRWSRASEARGREAASSRNLFGVVAEAFFFPLLSGWHGDPIATRRLLNEDFMLLGKFVSGPRAGFASHNALCDRLARNILTLPVVRGGDCRWKRWVS